jgi:hypothetical protein
MRTDSIANSFRNHRCWKRVIRQACRDRFLSRSQYFLLYGMLRVWKVKMARKSLRALLYQVFLKISWYPRTPCGAGVEYLYRNPVSRRRRRKGKSRNSQVWPGVPRDSDMRMTALARASSNCKLQTRPLVSKPATDSKWNLIVRHRWVLYSKTDWPTDRQS